jgi:hypothetical protein
LKRLKTGEEKFGKAWRFQAKSLEIFGKNLEKAWIAGAAGIADLFALAPG